MPKAMSDRRITPRYTLVLVAELTDVSSGIKTNARTSDISRTGCYIDTLNPYPLHTTLRVRLVHSSGTFESLGKVVYRSPALGMGVRFEEPVPAQQIALLESWFRPLTPLGG